jgi:hypothetical protein
MSTEDPASNPNPNPNPSRLRPAEGVRWAVEDAGVLVVDELRRLNLRLGYPQAAVWDLLARGRELADVAGLIVRVGRGLGQGQGLDTLAGECAAEWLREGWLRPLDGADGADRD